MSSRARRNYDYDAISSLPDTVLSHILSFLPTKQVVATSVLSKRWMHQWRSVLDINLINGKHKEYGGYYYEPIELDDEYTLFSFNEFVYSVLLKLDTIKSFHLKVGYGNSSLEYRGFPSVVKWVDHIVKRGVERLRLTLFTSIDMKLPISILSCRTLVVLNLFAFAVKGFSSVRLPSLKILSLEDCSFLNYRALVLLLIGCPILEELYTTHLEFHFDDSFTHEECESLSLSKLTNAQMPYTYCHFPLKALHNVANLYIELNQLYRSYDEIPTFHNLTKLKLHSINSNWNLLVEVLNHCPKLQNLELDEGSTVDTRQYVQKNWVDPKLVPECLSLHLKTCIFQNFLGQQGELLSTIYILKNARVLQTMIICGAEGLKIERDLSLYPRACPTCELILNADKFSPDRIRFDQLL